MFYFKNLKPYTQQLKLKKERIKSPSTIPLTNKKTPINYRGFCFTIGDPAGLLHDPKNIHSDNRNLIYWRKSVF